jgi:UDP-N-acetylmuramate dehydrogenase
VVLDVTYALERTDSSRPITYLELVKALGGKVGDRADTAAVRDAVLRIRRGRRMVLDPDDHDTWSVGSFFLNPIVPEVPERLKDCPVNDDPNGHKLAAGWIIQHSGFPPGYGQDFGTGRVALSSKHALAITNRGGATTADIMTFAAHVRAGVEEKFGIRLNPECDLVNCSF